MSKTADLIDAALEKLIGDMDDLEGSAATAHDVDSCPDPLTCKAHDGELGENLSQGGDGVEVEVKKIGKGVPSLDGAAAEAEAGADEGLSPAEVEDLRKLLK